MKKNDRRNNGIGLLTKIWYYAEAWLELNRLAALCGGRAVLQNRNWIETKIQIGILMRTRIFVFLDAVCTSLKKYPGQSS
jgi:hypothetical protein